MNNYYQGVRTNSEVFKQLFCKDLLFVYSDCPFGCTRQKSWSQYSYILYIVSGKKNIYTNNKSWMLEEGMAVFVKKGACIIEKVDGEVLCLMAFFIPDSYLRVFLNENMTILANSGQHSSGNDLVLPIEVNELMVAYYESIKPYFFSAVKPHEYLLELKFRELLFNVFMNPANRELRDFLHSFVAHQANNISAIIEANYCYNLSLDEYAKLCNRSLSSFKRDFYNIYGESPARWLLEKRLAFAKNMLSSSKNPIVDISFKSGFENSSHFSHAFKKHFGVSPMKYRQKIQG